MRADEMTKDMAGRYPDPCPNDQDADIADDGESRHDALLPVQVRPGSLINLCIDKCVTKYANEKRNSSWYSAFAVGFAIAVASVVVIRVNKVDIDPFPSDIAMAGLGVVAALMIAISISMSEAVKSLNSEAMVKSGERDIPVDLNRLRNVAWLRSVAFAAMLLSLLCILSSSAIVTLAVFSDMGHGERFFLTLVALLLVGWGIFGFGSQGQVGKGADVLENIRHHRSANIVNQRIKRINPDRSTSRSAKLSQHRFTWILSYWLSLFSIIPVGVWFDPQPGPSFELVLPLALCGGMVFLFSRFSVRSDLYDSGWSRRVNLILMTTVVFFMSFLYAATVASTAYSHEVMILVWSACMSIYTVFMSMGYAGSGPARSLARAYIPLEVPYIVDRLLGVRKTGYGAGAARRPRLSTKIASIAAVVAWIGAVSFIVWTVQRGFFWSLLLAYGVLLIALAATVAALAWATHWARRYFSSSSRIAALLVIPLSGLLVFSRIPGHLAQQALLAALMIIPLSTIYCWTASSRFDDGEEIGVRWLPLYLFALHYRWRHSRAERAYYRSTTLPVEDSSRPYGCEKDGCGEVVTLRSSDGEGILTQLIEDAARRLALLAHAIRRSRAGARHQGRKVTHAGEAVDVEGRTRI